ncbi:MAG: tetratricopeptide repeat protein, partial [Proteobacteria bacterium]|nr:tetratricopeptide repeat protein [Pseudomonadota bacterium]
MAINALPSRRKGALSSYYSVLSRYYAYSGDFGSSNQAFNQAEFYFFSTRFQGDRTLAHLNSARGIIEQLKGNLLRAEQLFRDAISEFRGLGWINLYETVQADLAENLMRQGRLAEAEAVARESIGSTGTASEGSKILLVMSKILLEQGRYSEAEFVGKAAVDQYISNGVNCSSLRLNGARQVVAQSLIARDRWADAVAQFEAIRKAMKDDVDAFESGFAGNVDWALALHETGRTEKAAQILQIALDRMRKRVGEKHYRTAEIKAFLAITQAARGERKRALKEFSEAISILLTRSRQADDESLTQDAQDRRLVAILEGYMGLLADLHGAPLEIGAAGGMAAEAFRLADISRGRSVMRALAASGARAATKDPDLAELARQEQDMQKRISALYGVLVNASSEFNSKVIKSLRVKIDQLRGARATLMNEIVRRFPDYARLINPKPVTIEGVQANLGPKEALISIYVGKKRTFVWAVPNAGEVAFAVVPLGRERIAAVVHDLRRALDPQATTLGGIPSFDVSLSHRLYRALLEPVQVGWKGANNLLVVTHGALGQLPFSVLVTKPARLMKESDLLFANYRDVPW